MIEHAYFIMNESDERLAEAELISFGPDNMMMEVNSIDQMKLLKGRSVVHLSEQKKYAEILEGQVESIGDNQISIVNLKNLSAIMRQDLKVCVCFDEWIRPILPEDMEESEAPVQVESVEIMAKDISCSGIGFYVTGEFNKNFNYELILPILSEPMIVELKIVRVEFDEEMGRYLCGARFMNLRYEEERILRRTIMRMQVLEMRRLKERLSELEEQRWEETKTEKRS